MKTVFYITGGYLVLVGIAAFISNSATDSPTADAFSGLPSVGTFLGANNVKTEGGINIAAGLAFFSLAYLNVV